VRACYLLGPVDDLVDVEKLVDYFWLFRPLANHEQNRHHESDLVPKESRAFDDTLVHAQLRALGVLLHELSAEGEDAAHVVLLFVVLVLQKALVFLAEVAKIVQPNEFLSCFRHQLDVEVLSEEEIVVLAEDA
jgi:hypothetical protein